MAENLDIQSVLLDNRFNSNRAKLAQLASSDEVSDLVKDISTQDIPTQLRAFLLYNSKSELIRMVKKSDKLAMLEDVYMRRALEEAEDVDMKSLGEMLKNVTASLDHSMDIVSNIVEDNKLNVTINQKSATIVNNNGGAVSVGNTVSVVGDKASREKLRNLTTKLFSALGVDPSTLVNAAPGAVNEADVVNAELVEVDKEDSNETGTV